MIKVRTARVEEAQALAVLHGACFDEEWNALFWRAAILDDATTVWGAERAGRLIGLLAVRHVVDEAEILTIAVRTAERRAGVAAALLDHGLSELQKLDIETVFLEVATDNEAALKLYDRYQFQEVGHRPAYYADGRNAYVLARKFA